MDEARGRACHESRRLGFQPDSGRWASSLTEHHDGGTVATVVLQPSLNDPSPDERIPKIPIAHLPFHSFISGHAGAYPPHPDASPTRFLDSFPCADSSAGFNPKGPWGSAGVRSFPRRSTTSDIAGRMMAATRQGKGRGGTWDSADWRFRTLRQRDGNP